MLRGAAARQPLFVGNLMIMGWLQLVGALYGLFLIGSGIEGYVSKKSLISLIAGAAAGIVVLIGVWLASRTTSAYILIAVVAVAMIGRFLPAFLKAEDPVKAVWPSLVITSVSAIVLICLIAGHFLAKRPPAS